jgi:hypothetical protein
MPRRCHIAKETQEKVATSPTRSYGEIPGSHAVNSYEWFCSSHGPTAQPLPWALRVSPSIDSFSEVATFVRNRWPESPGRRSRFIT